MEALIPPPKLFKRSSSAGTVMTSIFWDSQGVTMVDYLEEGRTISGAHYAEKIGRLRQEIVKQNSEKLT